MFQNFILLSNNRSSRMPQMTKENVSGNYLRPLFVDMNIMTPEIPKLPIRVNRNYIVPGENGEPEIIVHTVMLAQTRRGITRSCGRAREFLLRQFSTAWMPLSPEHFKFQEQF